MIAASSSLDLSFLPAHLRSPSPSSLAFTPSRFPYLRSLYSPDPALPDYYTPPNFLHFLRQFNDRTKLNPIPLLPLFLHSASVIQRISLLLLHYLLFYSLSTPKPSDTPVSIHPQYAFINTNIILFCTGLLLFPILSPTYSNSPSFTLFSSTFLRLPSLTSFFTSAALILLLYLVTPLLAHLTPSYSSDTIAALSIFFDFLHIVTFDYRLGDSVDSFHSSGSSVPSFIPSPGTASIPSYTSHSTISLNSALFTSILLASRLQSHDTAFQFLYFSFLQFGYQPSLQRRLYSVGSSTAHFFFTALYSFSVIYLLHYFSFPRSLPILLSLVFLSVQFILPLIYRFLHSRKVQWRGGWDYEDENEVTKENL